MTAGEISRFCVSSRYRRRTSQEVRIARTSSSPVPGSVGSLLESRDPWILIGLLRAMLSQCGFATLRLPR